MSVYLKKVSINRFKQFENVVFDLSDTRDYAFNRDVLTPNGKLVKLGLVYGRNGAGKSNLGLAIMDITLHLTDAVKNLGLYECYVNADSDVREVEFSFEFLNDEDIYRYDYRKKSPEICTYERFSVNEELVFEVDHEKGILKVPGKSAYGFDTLLVKDLNISLLRYIFSNSNLKEDNPIRLVMDFVRRMLFFKRVDSGNCFIGLKNQSDNLYGFIVKNNYLKEFESFLSQAGIHEELIAEDDRDYGNIRICFKHKHQNLPISLVGSSGTHAICLFFYWLKHFQKASFVFIDEFDAFYHFQLAEIIYRTIKNYSSEDSFQCVMTTHNTNLLSNRYGRPDCFYIVTPKQVSSMASLTNREIREGNNVENLYMGQAFGVF